MTVLTPVCLKKNVFILMLVSVYKSALWVAPSKHAELWTRVYANTFSGIYSQGRLPWFSMVAIFIALCRYCFVLLVCSICCVHFTVPSAQSLALCCLYRTFCKAQIICMFCPTGVCCPLHFRTKALSLWFLFLVLPNIFTSYSIEIEVYDCVYKVWFICY